MGKEIPHAVIPDVIKGFLSQICEKKAFLAADIVGYHITGRIGDKGKTGESKPGSVVPGLIDGHDIQAVVVRSGRYMAHPGLEFFFGGSPWRSMGNENSVGTFFSHTAGDKREMSVIAELNAETKTA